MAQQSYFLYRVKLIPPKQTELFPEGLSGSELLRSAISEKPSAELYGETVWHLGNLEDFEGGFGAFAIGKTTRATVEKYDTASGNFVEREDEPGPYTWVVYDQSLGVLGIAHKPRLAPRTSVVAKRLSSILQSSREVSERKFDVRVDPIADPMDFIGKLSTAYSIKRFTATFTGPNPVDADELFQRPLAVYCHAISAERGSVEVRGHSLDEPTAVAVARATAATGNDASAMIQPNADGKEARISLHGDNAMIGTDEATPRAEVAQAVRAKYDSIRET